MTPIANHYYTVNGHCVFAPQGNQFRAVSKWCKDAQEAIDEAEAATGKKWEELSKLSYFVAVATGVIYIPNEIER